MAEKKTVARSGKKSKPGAGKRAPGGTSRAFAALFAALTRAYGRRRRQTREETLDRIVLAVLSEGVGERTSLRFMGRIGKVFVDWNEVRVARPRDLMAAAPDAPEDRVKSMQALLQALYENLGGLDIGALQNMKSAELRTWLARLGPLGREEAEAVMMIALDRPVIPANDGVARVLRRTGLVPRKASRARAQRAVLKGVAPGSYRDFYGLALEHAVSVCHDQVPDCARCKLKRNCKSRGRW